MSDLVCLKQLPVAATTVRRWRRLGLLPAPTIIRGVYYFPADAIQRAQTALTAGADSLLFCGRRGRGRPRLEELIGKGGGR